MLRYPFGVGSHAEYVAAPSRTFVRKPEAIDHVQAGAIPLAALTAWQALVDTADLQAGQRVLVHAAAGGVGHLAVQIAKARGAHVIGTARAAKHGFVRGLGADEVIDYTEVDFAEAVRDVDVVLDAIGGDYGPRSLRTMRPGGTMVSLLPRGVAEDVAPLAEKLGVRHEVMLVEPDHFAMKEIAALAASGRLRAEIDAVFPLERAAEAIQALIDREVIGKAVLVG
jgi:NADPH:quinone reductase-like Zn-dependent oxidoreductase